MEPLVLLPLAAFLILVALFLRFVQRAARLVARTRELDGFRTAVRDLGGRIGTSLDGAAQRIDGVRRQQHPASTIRETIDAATDAVDRYADEVRALKGPPEAVAIRDDILDELGRAGRALAMVDHGASILAAVRRGGRELEAQTSIKRGYLNLLHAREAIARHAARVDDLEADRVRRPSAARPAPAAPVPVSAPSPTSPDPRNEPSDHTM